RCCGFRHPPQATTIIIEMGQPTCSRPYKDSWKHGGTKNDRSSLNVSSEHETTKLPILGRTLLTKKMSVFTERMYAVSLDLQHRPYSCTALPRSNSPTTRVSANNFDQTQLFSQKPRRRYFCTPSKKKQPNKKKNLETSLSTLTDLSENIGL
ncbi:unnamed protein product, partial [Ectocarpus sp. 8 AP-2014]